MIEAIFLDAGGVILDESVFEDAKSEIITGLLSKFESYSTEDYWKDTGEAVHCFVSSTYEYVIFKHTGEGDGFSRIFGEYRRLWKERKIPYRLMPGLPGMLERLSGRYRFGILGQYGADLREFLEEQDVRKHFAFTETQEGYGVTKPDPRYFQAILDKANCSPAESLMVGDRIDKDIYPSNVLGMKTIRLRTGLHKSQRPRIPIEVPTTEIDSLDELTDDLIHSIEGRAAIDPFFVGE